MTFPLEQALLPRERQALLRLLQDVGEELSLTSPPTLEDLFVRWEKFVAEVEAGYLLSIYDYTRDLSVRDTLEEIMKGLPGSDLKNRIRERLTPFDDRFRLATSSSDKPIAPGADLHDRLWWFRIPRRLVGELREDCAAEGLL
jgi:hypothetical protein